ncbi:hypothetical protein JRQ81_004617 [Phrynocephalus forsythii]|uniref:Uncharacterized protein n=1 Tax=Phrynocephalus forsythii TaxID=171643 RepID=A0A9Q0XHM5_9SAUR|nr:hypothetical protein JRQ81_004617 [Phrynocephalus forsythii]
MGSKFPGCFPRGRRWRRSSSKTAQQDPPAAGAASEEPEPRAARSRSTPSTSSEAEAEGGRAYFSTKARVSLRHQLDSERDATT